MPTIGRTVESLRDFDFFSFLKHNISWVCLELFTHTSRGVPIDGGELD